MKLINKGRKKGQLWRGTCRSCGAVYEAERSELNVERCFREQYEFAHHDCTECGAKKGMAIVFHPVKD